MSPEEEARNSWLEMRRSKIGASDAPVIMGVSPWMTPYQLWEQKMKLRPDPVENFAMRRGKELEPIALLEFERLVGIEMDSQTVVHHLEYPWMMATVDGVNWKENMVVEIKCPGKVDHQCSLRGKIPEKYLPQLQHILEVTGMNKICYFSYNQSFDEQSCKMIEVLRDKEYSTSLIREELAFWDCMQNFRPPEIGSKAKIISLNRGK